MTDRLFIALEIPENILLNLIKMRDEVCSDKNYRWEPLNKLHITLKFLGDVESAKKELIINSLKESLSCKKELSLQFSKFGLFFRNNNPSILWAGFNSSEELQRLHKDVESAVKNFGFKEETRKFKPHITLLRIKGRENFDQIKKLSQMKIEVDPFKGREVALYKSTLLKSGSVYEKVKNFELK